MCPPLTALTPLTVEQKNCLSISPKVPVKFSNSWRVYSRACGYSAECQQQPFDPMSPMLVLVSDSRSVTATWGYDRCFGVHFECFTHDLSIKQNRLSTTYTTYWLTPDIKPQSNALLIREAYLYSRPTTSVLFDNGFKTQSMSKAIFP